MERGHQTVEPVMIELTRACRFKRKPCKTCGKAQTNVVHRKKTGTCKFKLQTKCERCNKPKAHIDHLGAPPSYNILGSGHDKTYIGLKQTWEPVLVGLLEESGLPKPLRKVMVEGEVSYGKGNIPDEDNAMALIRKFLGDALQRGEWLDKDKWGRIDFTKLELRDEPGVSRLRLYIMPVL